MLRVQVIGPLRIELNGLAIEPRANRREWSLLAWLALNPGRHARGEVAARFWPDVLDTSARASLRSCVWALRRALGEAADHHLLAGHDELALVAADGLWVDALAFAELLEGGRLDEAVALADGRLLAGFDDDWVAEERAAYCERLAGALERLAAAAEVAGDGVAAIGWTRRQAALDPLDEEAHRRLMRRLTAAGQRAAALGEYQRLRERLRRELAVTPSLATRRLAERLRDDAADATVEARPLPRPSIQPTLVGRDRELAELLAAWRAAQDGAGGAIVIAGEAGIGKTRLAAELAHRAVADGARAAICGGIDLAGAAPMGLWAELIGELTPELEAPPLDAAWPADLAALASDLERRFGRPRGVRPVASPELERARLYEAAVELVAWAARSRPVVLVMEDVHLADAASLQLAGYVGRRLTRLPVLMVLTRRPLPRRAELDSLEQLLRARGALLGQLTLGPLATDALERLARDVADLDPDAVAEALRTAEGSPLLVVERIRALARGEREPPASLRAAVRAALASLSESARTLADFAAVAGRDLARGELDALPLDTPSQAATAAVDTGLLVAGRGRVGYRHALLRDAAYSDLPDPRRAWLHEALANALQVGDATAPAAEIARHLRLAGRDDRAVGELARAAAHARTVGALDEAAAFLREAIELAGEDAALLLELAEVEAWRSRTEASDDAFARAVDRTPGPGEELARAWLRRAHFNRGALCRPREILEAARRAVEVLDAAAVTAPDVRSEALATWAWAEAVAGDPDLVERLLADVHAVVGREGGGPMLAQAVGGARALALVRQGRFEESYAPGIAAGEAAQRAGRADLACGCWLNAACAATCVGQFDRALEFVDRGTEAVRGQHLGWFEVQNLAARAHVLVRLGRLAEARDAADEEGAVADRIDSPELRATADHDQGMVALALGDHERAAVLLARALDHDPPVSRPLARLARAEALVRRRRCDEAEAELRAAALEPLRPSDFPETLVPRLTRIQGLLAAARGDRELAGRRLHEAAAGWRRLLDRSSDGERYTTSFADLARPPVLGLVEPQRELARVETELHEIATAPV